MSASVLFFIIIGIILLNFIIDSILDALNAKHYKDPIPNALNDVFDAEEYQKSQAYKLVNYKFGVWSSLFSLVLTLGFLFFDGFEYVDNIARSYSSSPIVIGFDIFWHNYVSQRYSINTVFILQDLCD
jgi:STE24 endopeptidase